jgi:4-aminobutyrate aminotransferase-like enzyme
VEIMPLPDPYRGGGANYAAYVAAAARAGAPAAFFAESASGCGGQVFFPDEYLKHAFAAVRAAGGVCVADEVQTGFGRAGSHFWMFETQGAVPDIVTMGKPIANGHPMGAVVTTREIAASFANGMEYFNTFGGNPVSCAAALATLAVIREEGLQENARATGEYLLAGLRDLAARHRLIGDVRGRGLFLGIELVRDRETKEPAPSEASALVDRMKDLGILLSTDGPWHNVIKIKPPIVFGRQDADLLLDRLGSGLKPVAC